MGLIRFGATPFENQLKTSFFENSGAVSLQSSRCRCGSMVGTGMRLCGYKVGGGEAKGVWEMMAEEEEEVKEILSKLQVRP